MKKILALGTFVTIVTSAFNYISQVLLIEIAGFDSRGMIEIAASVISLSSTFLSFNAYLSLTMYVRKHKGIPPNVNYIFLIITTIQSFGCALLVEATKLNVSSISHHILTAVIVLSAILNNYINIHTALFNGFQVYIAPRVSAAVGASITFLCLIVFWMLNSVSPHAVVYAVIFLPFAFSGVPMFLYKKVIEKKTAFVKFSIKKAAFDLWPAYLISVAQISANRIFLLYISSVNPLRDVGAFAFSNSIMQLALLPMSLVATIVISTKASGANEKRKFFTLLLYLAAAAFGYLVLSSGMLETIPLKSFRDKTVISNAKILIWTLPFVAATTVAIADSVSKQKFTKLLLLSQCALLPLQILLYEFCKSFEISDPIPMSASVATIVVSIFCYKAS